MLRVSSLVISFLIFEVILWYFSYDLAYFSFLRLFSSFSTETLSYYFSNLFLCSISDLCSFWSSSSSLSREKIRYSNWSLDFTISWLFSCNFPSRFMIRSAFKLSSSFMRLYSILTLESSPFTSLISLSSVALIFSRAMIRLVLFSLSSYSSKLEMLDREIRQKCLPGNVTAALGVLYFQALLTQANLLNHPCAFACLCFSRIAYLSLAQVTSCLFPSRLFPPSLSEPHLYYRTIFSLWSKYLPSRAKSSSLSLFISWARLSA